MICAELREVAPDLALDTLDGAERAAAVNHLAGCAECAAHVAELGRTVDVLLLTGPEAEPSAGFESRVLRRLGRRRPRRTLLAVAAVVALLVAGLGLGATLRQDSDVLAAGAMRDDASTVVGSAVIYGGRTPFVFVTVDGWGESGDYRVDLVLRDGSHVDVGPIRLAGGRGHGGGRLTVDPGRIRAVWVTDTAREEWCAYRL